MTDFPIISDAQLKLEEALKRRKNKAAPVDPFSDPRSPAAGGFRGSPVRPTPVSRQTSNPAPRRLLLEQGQEKAQTFRDREAENQQKAADLGFATPQPGSRAEVALEARDANTAARIEAVPVKIQGLRDRAAKLRSDPTIDIKRSRQAATTLELRADNLERIYKEDPEKAAKILDPEFYQQEITEPFAGSLINLAQTLIPGKQEIERRAEGLRADGINPIDAARQAYLASDLGSTKVDITPGFDIPLPGGRKLDEVDVGVKGFTEIFGDPVELAPGVGFVPDVIRATGLAARSALAAGRNAGRVADDVADVAGDVLRSQSGAIGPEDISRAADEPVGTGRPVPGMRNRERLGLRDFILDQPREVRDSIIEQNPNLASGLTIPASGKAALLKRLELEGRLGRLNPDVVEVAEEWIGAIPEKYLDDLGSSYVNDLAEIAQGKATLGQYDPNAPGSVALINIVKRFANEAVDGDRVIVHEVSHHLEQFVKADDARKLVTQYRIELRTRGQSLMDEAGRLRASKRKLTEVEQQKLRDAYRFEGGFPEWFAEVMTDKALRDIYMDVPEYRTIIQRALDKVKELAAATRNFILRRGGSRDEAERVYQNLLKGNYTPEERRILHTLGDDPLLSAADEPLPDWAKLDFAVDDASRADATASRAIWDVTTPGAAEPTIVAAQNARGQMSSLLSSYPDVPPLLARRGEVEAFLATKGQGDLVRAIQEVKAARKFWEGPYGGRGNRPQWERVILNAEEAIKRAGGVIDDAPAPRVATPPPPATAGTPPTVAPPPASVATPPVAPIRNQSPPPRKPPSPPSAADEPLDAAFPEGQDEASSFLAKVKASNFDERLDQTALRLHEAAINNEQRLAAQIVESGNRELRALGIGTQRQRSLVPLPKDIPVMDDLFRALHNPSKVASGEIQVPANLQNVFDELRKLTDWETTARLDFDPNMAMVDDYFYRGWKPPEDAFIPGVGGDRGRLVSNPAFKKPRNGATYDEMRERGFEPLFWNPYEQFRVSRLQGIKYRQQTELVNTLKSLGDDLARPHAGGPIPKGWRVPQVGPGFEGKPFVFTGKDGNAVQGWTKRWIVPDEVANPLESMYGKKPSMGKVTVAGKSFDPMSIVDWLTFVPKRAKLLGSFFQQMDFARRAGIGSFGRAVDAAIAGEPLEVVRALVRLPKTWADMLHANVSPGFRRTLQAQLDETTPLIQGRPGITVKGITDAGLSTIDISILPQDLDRVVREVAEETGVSHIKSIGRSITALEGATRRGLFDGVYPAAILNDVRNNIAPQMARLHPELSDLQLNGLIARAANIRYSTLPATQQYFQNRVVRESLRRLFFSVNESEGLIKQALGALKGPDKVFWLEHWIGAYLFLGLTAEVIHMASTGEALPKERFVPLAKTNYGPLPFGYRRDFLSPTLPFEGRGGAELTLDLMGQMDTAFRVLDPVSFFDSRFSVPIKAGQTQVTGANFFGEAIDDVGPGGVASRTAQLLTDLFLPIGPGQGAMAVARQKIPGAAELVPSASDSERIGPLGTFIQSLGENIRSETTGTLVNRWAAESGFTRADGTPVTKWSELTKSQEKELRKKHGDELDTRDAESQRRVDVSPSVASRAARDDVDSRRLVKEEALGDEFASGQIEADDYRGLMTRVRDQYRAIQATAAAERSQTNLIYQQFQEERELPEDPLDRATVEYYKAFDDAQLASGLMDFTQLDETLTALEASWTPAQRAHVEEDTGQVEHAPFIEAQRSASETLRPYWEASDRMRERLRRNASNDIDLALVTWYGYSGVTPEGARRKRQIDALFKRGDYASLHDLLLGESSSPSTEPSPSVAAPQEIVPSGKRIGIQQR